MGEETPKERLLQIERASIRMAFAGLDVVCLDTEFHVWSRKELIDPQRVDIRGKFLQWMPL